MELMEMVKAHSLLASKFLPRTVDVDHPQTNLFLNSNGKKITSIPCNHFKKFIGLPITAYDFRRSLTTFCLDNKDQTIRNAESSVLRHNESTAFAYYYAHHSNNVERVNIEYARKNKLIRAEEGDMDKYTESLRRRTAEEEWELNQRRIDKSMEVKRQAFLQRKKKQDAIKEKGTRHLILPSEYEVFKTAFDEAVSQEKFYKVQGKKGPFKQLLKYLPEAGGIFPPNSIWSKDYCRLLFGLDGEKGVDLRKADLSVYDGEPFGKFSGRKKIEEARNKSKANFNPYTIVSQYWRDKIRYDTRSTVSGHWNQIKFAFNDSDIIYFNEKRTMS